MVLSYVQALSHRETHLLESGGKNQRFPCKVLTPIESHVKVESMNLKKILTHDSVKIGLKGSTKREIIEELVDIIVTHGRKLDKAVLLKAVLDREEQMSTGLSNGIAIPHGKTDAVSELYPLIAVSTEPVEFESLDKEPSNIFIMTISPETQTGPHLQFLAEVSRLLTREDIRRRVLAAKTEADLLAIFLEGRI